MRWTCRRRCRSSAARWAGTVLRKLARTRSGAVGGGTNGETWSEAEKAQIRQALGVDGTKVPAAGVDLQSAMRRAFAALVSEFGITSEDGPSEAAADPDGDGLIDARQTDWLKKLFTQPACVR